MLKILIHNFIALQFFCSSTGVVSTLKAQFEFWVKSPLKMHCTKNFLDIKDITNFNTQIYSTKNFLYLNGCGLYPDSGFRFLGEKSLKNSFYKTFSRHKRRYKWQYAISGAKIFSIAPRVWPLS